MSLESRVDVLIVGAGPAGLTCANALAMAGIHVRIIDKRPLGVAAGQADGFSPRTMEVLQSYGLAERLIREGSQVHMHARYDPGRDGGIECTLRKSYVMENVYTPFPFVVTLGQEAIEANFIDSLKSRGVQVERPKQPSALEISEDVDELTSPSSYPVKVTIENIDSDLESKSEIIHAKYVIGTDGAHSWVRKTVGIRMEGEQSEFVWGVVDLVPETNFPDIRNLATIRSSSGSCLTIPREDDKNRLYIQLSFADLDNPSTERVDKSSISVERLISVCQKIIQPYHLSASKEVDWWSVYTIGQRVASSYSVKNRVFIAGDACHTHSPKRGQGMNASINDAHNLAWKLAQVLRGWSNPSLLLTYEHERRAFGLDLIRYDKEYSKAFSTKARTTENEDGLSLEQFTENAPVRSEFFTGLGIQYSPSAIVDAKHQQSAENIIVGQRMLPCMFVRAADIRPMEIQDMLPADIRFKVLFFVGKLSSERITELNVLADTLNKPSSFLYRYSTGGEVSTVFDIITIVSGKKTDLAYTRLPAFFRPHWSKILLDDTDTRNLRGGHGYENYGIDPKGITLVVVRPDQYVGTVVPSTAIADLEAYFSSFLVPRSLESQ